jgi:DNA-directed RNA polymerase subunit K/omega
MDTNSSNLESEIESEIEIEDDSEIFESDNNETENKNTQTKSCMYESYKNEDDENDSYNYNQEIENTNKEILLEKENRITQPILTKYEFVRIIGTRTKQIELGSKKFIKNVGNMKPKEVALLELKHKRIPFKIKRKLPNNKYEIWSINELSYPNFI